MASGVRPRSARVCGAPRLACIVPADEEPYRVYSTFDWWAMIFGRIVNAMATTCLTPVAYALTSQHNGQVPAGGAASTAERKVDRWINDTAYGDDNWYNYDDWLAVPDELAMDTGLVKSGGIIAAVAIGAMLSTAAAFFILPDTWKDGKLPFALGTFFPYLGILIYTVAVMTTAEPWVIVLSRIALALGYGLQFCIKRQIARVTNSSRRGTLMLWNNTFDIVGMASGPALVGIGVRLFEDEKHASDPRLKLLVPAVLLFVIVTFNVFAIVFTDIDEPFYADGTTPPRPTTAASAPDERTPLYDPKAAAAAAPAAAPPPPTAAAAAAAAAPPPPEPPRSPATQYFVARSIQLTCVTYTFTRVFLRYAYESAMVVVYSQTYDFSDGDAGMIAGGSAFTALIAVFLWRQVQQRVGGASLKHAAHTVMVVSEICGFCCALVMIVTPSIRLSLGRRWGIFFTLLTAVFFYPSQVLGASIANSYPLDFAVPSSSWLHRNAMLAQQELIMPIGNGLGMFLGRIMMGTDHHTYLRALGTGFLLCMLLQAAIVGVGWDPERSYRLWQRLRGRPDPPSDGGTALLSSASGKV